MDRLDSLKFFIRLVEKRGIAAAGRDFGLSPATASERLNSLEKHYGAKLLNRTTRSISLTEEGRRLLKGAQALIDEADELEAQIRLGTNQISGPIKVSTAQDLGQGHIAPLLDQFLKAHPAVRINLVLEDRHQDIITRGIDIAIRLGKSQDSTLRTRKLATNKRIVCASPEYINAHGKPKHPEELVHHNCLVMHWGHAIDNEWHFNIQGKAKTIKVSGDRAANNGLQVKQWCLQGYGIALKSIWDVDHEIKAGNLVPLLQEFQPDSNSAVQLLFPGGRQPPRRVRVLIEYLVESFKTRSTN